MCKRTIYAFGRKKRPSPPSTLFESSSPHNSCGEELLVPAEGHVWHMGFLTDTLKHKIDVRAQELPGGILWLILSRVSDVVISTFSPFYH